MNNSIDRLDPFLEEWPETEEQNKKTFLLLRKLLSSMASVQLEFVVREGVTYSLRAKHEEQSARPLFVMVDVIEGEPRWLSVCFYADMIEDPAEKGDYVPEGLLGEDALCFDVEHYSPEVLEYLQERLKEAWRSADR